MPDRDLTALVIEDDDDVRRLLQIVLAQKGFTTTTASTGAEGVDAARSSNFDLISVDKGLPDMDGDDVVRRIRETFEGTVVIVSARTSDEDQADSYAAGADAYLTKPFRPRELAQSITTLLASKTRP